MVLHNITLLKKKTTVIYKKFFSFTKWKKFLNLKYNVKNVL